MNLILFDIDGTLCKRAYKHMLAFRYAIKKVYGKDILKAKINFSGMCDKGIIIGLCKKLGVEEKEILENLDLCKQEIIDHYKRRKDILITKLPGAKNLLKNLHDKGHILGLATGNLEQIALTKMKTVDLDYFRFGGFGDNNTERTGLLKDAIKKASEHARWDKIFYLGDTPRDIQASKKLGIPIVSVATGRYSMQELLEFEPEYCFKGLKDTKKLLRILDS